MQQPRWIHIGLCIFPERESEYEKDEWKTKWAERPRGVSFPQFLELWRSHIDKQHDEMAARTQEMRILFGEGLEQKAEEARSGVGVSRASELASPRRP